VDYYSIGLVFIGQNINRPKFFMFPLAVMPALFLPDLFHAVTRCRYLKIQTLSGDVFYQLAKCPLLPCYDKTDYDGIACFPEV
jgi:hypothetical protein